MAQKLTIEFEPKGNEALVRAIKRLNEETKKLNRNNSKLVKGQKKVIKETQRITAGNKEAKLGFLGLGGALSVVRSKMLLYSFAIGLVIRPLSRLVGKTLTAKMQFEALETRLKVMTGSTAKAAKAFDTFNRVAAKTPFTLKDITEAGVAIQAFGANAEESIVPVADLAAFMGVNATDAAQAFGRAFAGGAGAADILRERGVLQLVKDFKGIEDLTKLTLPEFREALISTMKDPTAGIAKSTEELSKTFSGSYSNMQDSLTRVSAAMGEKLAPAVKQVMDEISGAADALTDFLEIPDRFEQGAINFEKRQDKLAKLSLPELKLQLEEAKLSMENYKKEVDSTSKEQKKIETTINPITGELKTLNLEIVKENDAFSDNIITIGEYTQQNEKLTQAMLDLGFTIPGLSEVLEVENQVMEESSNAILDVDQKMSSLQARIFELEEAIRRMGEDEGFFQKLFGMTDEEQEKFMKGWQGIHNSIMGVANAYDQLKMQQISQSKEAEMGVLKGIRNERIRQKKTEEIEAKYAEKVKRHKEDMKGIKIAEAISNTALGITKAFSDPGGIAGMIMAGLIGVQGALQLKIIQSQKYQYGGIVGGKRHSQGGTIIEAEQGEFVMSRDAVEAVGIENLNRMNTGLGGGGGSTIVINNPVLGKDMIEDEIVPQIQEALRRGGSIA